MASSSKPCPICKGKNRQRVPLPTKPTNVLTCTRGHRFITRLKKG